MKDAQFEAHKRVATTMTVCVSSTLCVNRRTLSEKKALRAFCSVYPCFVRKSYQWNYILGSSFVGRTHPFLFAKKTTDKSVKLSFVAYLSADQKTKEIKRKKNGICPKSLKFKKVLTRFFPLRTEMCWCDIRNLFENVQNITTISTSEFGGGDELLNFHRRAADEKEEDGNRFLCRFKIFSFIEGVVFMYLLKPALLCW